MAKLNDSFPAEIVKLEDQIALLLTTTEQDEKEIEYLHEQIAALEDKVAYLQNDNTDRMTEIKRQAEEIAQLIFQRDSIHGESLRQAEVKPPLTMHARYRDGSGHPVCSKCGYCQICGDCRNFGCGIKQEEVKDADNKTTRVRREAWDAGSV